MHWVIKTCTSFLLAAALVTGILVVAVVVVTGTHVVAVVAVMGIRVVAVVAVMGIHVVAVVAVTGILVVVVAVMGILAAPPLVVADVLVLALGTPTTLCWSKRGAVCFQRYCTRPHPHPIPWATGRVNEKCNSAREARSTTFTLIWGHGDWGRIIRYSVGDNGWGGWVGWVGWAGALGWRGGG
jgi:hypothetical protein